MIYRSLTTAEIQSLQAQGCHCNQWNLIEVAERFTPENMHGVRFSGKIRLGVFEKEILCNGGVCKKAGIINATIHNCEIGDNSYINHITNCIANYAIDSDCIIENVDLLETYPQAFFGNGTQVAVLDETGSRKVKIFEKLNAATAYILATFKHNTAAINAIEHLIDSYIGKKTADKGHIENHAVIRNCTSIIDVNIGAYAEIHGASLLKNGTVCSDNEAHTLIGHNVIANDFIIAKGAKVLDAAQIEACFVGEACYIGKGFSATHSLFFANCEMLHGEAVSVFAGPFTVSHHKATLLIGGMFSFFNAGSGANMSNHMYKLGPTHYGVMQRGAKMASDSYLLWPGKIGAFSVVIGKIKKHIDTVAFPFSYIVDSKEHYSLMPAMNLTSIGTYRDSKKWQSRDGRKNNEILDAICLESFTPFVIQQLVNAIKTLEELKKKYPEASAFTYNNCKINSSIVQKAISLYQLVIDIYIGRYLLKDRTPAKKGIEYLWLDLAGMVVPKQEITSLLSELSNKEITDIDAWISKLNSLQLAYENFEDAWIAGLLSKNKSAQIEAAITAEEKYKQLLQSDAGKEFAADAKICFGLNGDTDEKDAEFFALRGTVNDNEVVQTIIKEADKNIDLLKAL